MATSEVGICNVALAALRATLITSFSDGTIEADYCRELYPLARDFTLEQTAWPFALRRASLSLLSEPPASDWSYQYALPSDPWALLPVSTSLDAIGELWAWEGRSLLCNVGDGVTLLYVARIEDPNTFSPGFTQAVAAYLEYMLAPALTGSSSKQQRALEKFGKVLDTAISAVGVGGGTGHLDSFQDDTFLKARL